MSNDAIMLLNLPTGIPFVYELDENMKPVKSMEVSELLLHQIQTACRQLYVEYLSNYDIMIFSFFQFLGDEETVAKAMEAVAAQGKAKQVE